MAVIVAVVALEDLKEGERIVIVCNPAVAGHFKGTCRTGCQEDVPFLLCDLALDAELFFPHVLESFCNTQMQSCGVGGVLKGREAFTVRITRLGKELSCFLNILLVIGRISGEIIAANLTESRIAFRNLLSNDCRCRDFALLGNGLNNVVAVDRQRQSLSDSRIIKGFLLRLECEIIRTNLIDGAEVLALLQSIEFVNRQLEHIVELAVVISCQLCVVVFQKDKLQSAIGNLVRIIIIRVLHIGNALFVAPIGQHHRAIADERRRILGPTVVAFNNILANRIIDRECQKLIKVRAGSCQLNGHVGVVHLCNTQRGRIGFALIHISAALDHVKQVCIVGSRFRGSGTLPGIDEIVHRDRLTIGPLDVVAQGDVPSQTVIADVNLFCLAKNRVAVLIELVDAFKRMDRIAGAVHGLVQGRVQSLRLRADTSRDFGSSRTAVVGRSRSGFATVTAAHEGCRQHSNCQNGCKYLLHE